MLYEKTFQDPETGLDICASWHAGRLTIYVDEESIIDWADDAPAFGLACRRVHDALAKTMCEVFGVNSQRIELVGGHVQRVTLKKATEIVRELAGDQWNYGWD